VASSNQSSPAPRKTGQSSGEAQSWALPVPSRPELASAFAQALDLAEGREPGHAARVCYIALNLAKSLRLPQEEQTAVYYAALLHDAGAAPASAEICRLLNLNEEAIFGGPPSKLPHQRAFEIAPHNAAVIVEVWRSHLDEGERVARDLGFDTAVQQAIAAHHERWDGQGYPHSLTGHGIPVAGRLIAAADAIECLISLEPNPLTARRNIVSQLAEHAGTLLDAALAQKAAELVRKDTFWLGLHNDALTREVAASAPSRAREDRSLADLQTFARVFAQLADAKGEHTTLHGDRTAEIAGRVGEQLGLPEERRELLRIAALVHDVGLLGVPARVIAKPDILSLSEMESMRRHPSYSQLVLEVLPGLEDLALWAGAHHERPDGKGYPEMLEEDDIPVEARIIALADTYVALTSSRPYRQALSEEDAQQVLLGGAGSQLDKKLVQLLCGNGVTSSRSALRLRRKR